MGLVRSLWCQSNLEVLCEGVFQLGVIDSNMGRHLWRACLWLIGWLRFFGQTILDTGKCLLSACLWVIGWLRFLGQKFLDWFHELRKFLFNLVVWLSIRLFAVECSFSEVKNGTYTMTFENLNLDGAGDLDSLLAQANDRYQD